jgi:PIN domain nuclease of toxin-antitoxin system
MNAVVLDSSAILAVINNEPGAEKLTDEVLGAAVASTVNLAEVQSKLVAIGMDPREAWTAILSTVHDAAEFSVGQAEMTGNLIPQTRSIGLSLGDRACLALGISLKASIYTADRAWKNLKVGVRIHIIR